MRNLDDLRFFHDSADSCWDDSKSEIWQIDANHDTTNLENPLKIHENPFYKTSLDKLGEKEKHQLFPSSLSDFCLYQKHPCPRTMRRLPRWFHASVSFFFGSATSSRFGKSLCASSSAFRRPLQGLNCWEALHLNLLGYLLSLNEGEMFNGRKNRRFLEMPESVARCCIFRTVKKVKDVYKCTHTTMYICI